MLNRFLTLLLFMVAAGNALAASQPSSSSSEWISLFDGRSLQGWKASESAGSFKVIDGQIATDGPRAHLFYIGSGSEPKFKNFEFMVEVMARPGANSGVYFHSQYQQSGWPQKGFEIQINNTHKGEGDYREMKKTGSLYGIRNQYKSIVRDNEWFTIYLKVLQKHVWVRINDTLLVDYLEPEKPFQESEDQGRVLSEGTFALQCHDPGSKAFFRNIRVKPIPEASAAETQKSPVLDEREIQVLRLARDNFPLVDFHVHLKGGLTLEDALVESRKTGINYGVAPNCGVGFPITNDAGIDEFLKQYQGQPIFLGMQAEGREWVKLFSKQAIAKFDYVFTDAMTFTDDRGKRVRLWINQEVEIPDKQAFMEMYIDRILGVLNNEPIDIYVNPTFLPECIASEYDQLWTPERMQRVIDAARKNSVAIEINSRYRIPSPAFIKRAKAAGIKFSLGTNNADSNLGRLEYGLDMVKECGLTWKDMFMPKPDGQKPAQRRGP
ncbi:MAG TPA: family 16 glycoside hydrolase [Terriglobia bacterium]|nr:family 16 glycoside hydrolase [Terriglobia bacterium]